MEDLSTIPSKYQLRVRRKTLRRAIKRFATTQDFGCARPKLCFQIIGLSLPQYTPITPQTFEIARKMWVNEARLAREQGDKQREVAINIAWQHLKNWRCPVCGGLKSRTRSVTCGGVCGRKMSANAIRRIKGPIILKFNPKTSRATGSTYEGNGLRRAQFEMLKRTLEDCEGCVAEAARQLNMSYGTIKYYIRKFKAAPDQVKLLNGVQPAASGSVADVFPAIA